MDAVAVTYRHGPRGWDVFLSSGERLSAAPLDAIGGALAGAAPDDLHLSMAPQPRSASHAREQLRRARALPVPDGFVRMVQDLTGFEEEGDAGVMYVVLKERWNLDRRC